jgi:hypothetical protein
LSVASIVYPVAVVKRYTGLGPTDQTSSTISCRLVHDVVSIVCTRRSDSRMSRSIGT